MMVILPQYTHIAKFQTESFPPLSQQNAAIFNITVHGRIDRTVAQSAAT